VMILACFAAAPLTSLPEGGGVSGPLLLFLGLLTLLNAPFDWASRGLTRALLRRGLERGGWWPYLLALVDARRGHHRVPRARHGGWRADLRRIGRAWRW